MKMKCDNKSKKGMSREKITWMTEGMIGFHRDVI